MGLRFKLVTLLVLRNVITIFFKWDAKRSLVSQKSDVFENFFFVIAEKNSENCLHKWKILVRFITYARIYLFYKLCRGDKSIWRLLIVMLKYILRIQV